MQPPPLKRTDEDVPEPGNYYVSASQLKTWWDCPRKWGWSKIARIYEPSGKGAALGTLVHDQLEKYLRDGKQLDFILKNKDGIHPAEIATTGLEHLPAPKAQGLHVEAYFKFPVPGHPHIFIRGFKDANEEPNEDGIPHVLDHKTAGNWTYALTAEQLLEDPQAVIYAYDELLKYPSAPACNLSWIYYGTKKPYKSRPVRVTITRAQVDALMPEIFRGAVELAATYLLKPDPKSLPFNADVCGKYGGCAYSANCNLSPKERRPFSMTTATTASLTERIAARKAEMTGTPAPAAGMTPLQAKIAAAKAKAASRSESVPQVTDLSPLTQAAARLPLPSDAVLVREALPAWADPAQTPVDPIRLPPPLPVTDQPINCPADFQPAPSVADQQVDVAPELVELVSPKTKGRPKGSKNAPTVEGVDPALITRFLTAAADYYEGMNAKASK